MSKNRKKWKWKPLRILDYSDPPQYFRILINVFSSYYSGDLFLAFSQDNPKIGPIDIIMTFLFRIVIVCTLFRNRPLLLSRTHWVMTNPSSISMPLFCHYLLSPIQENVIYKKQGPSPISLVSPKTWLPNTT